jgi:acyl-CoA synthetase (AMP-forming)/AMP-acid ligase II
VVLCGTAFAFVHLLDALAREGRRLRLPPGSRVMETGGFKGRSREVTRDELHAALATELGVDRDRIVNQYGMTELASQFHDSVLRCPGEPRRKLGPPWTRVRLLDPETEAECAPGAVGRIAILDLANTGSLVALRTADLGRSVGDGFEVLGREAGAEARGCSLAADAMLERAAG